jgi:glycosyltransferase involved in cell wall biosynthesis
MKVLFLYTELADYFLKCCGELSDKCEVSIIRWPVNKEAPFEFRYPDKIKIYNKSDYRPRDLESVVQSIAPDMIVCSGWVDKEYLKITRKYANKIPTVLTCDTRWKGSVKQRIATLVSPFYLLKIFSHAWVPGEAQARYVKKLGFKQHSIKRGFYCCDLARFNSIYAEFKKEKKEYFPKKFIFAGRYYDFKGITDLWEAFAALQLEAPNEWELWCLGTGTVAPVQHPKIKHFGFVQPSALDAVIGKAGVFVLPSRFEPWGVVVQEYAAAGFPLILSAETGAAETFLEKGANGYSFATGEVESLKNVLKKVTGLSSKELHLMSERSHSLAQRINPREWTDTVMQIHNEFMEK